MQQQQRRFKVKAIDGDGASVGFYLDKGIPTCRIDRWHSLERKVGKAELKIRSLGR